MKLYAVRIFVDDWLTSCEFYEKSLGLKLEFKNEDFGWAEFNVGGANLGIERIDSNSSEEEHGLVGRFVGISLKVDSVEETYKKLRDEGVRFESGPEKQTWGGVTAQILDPSNNVITIMSED